MKFDLTQLDPITREFVQSNPGGSAIQVSSRGQRLYYLAVVLLLLFLRNDRSNDIKFSITILHMISDKRGNQVTYTILAILVYISTIRYVFLCIRVTLNAFKALWIHYHIDDMNLIRTDPIINKVLL